MKPSIEIINYLHSDENRLSESPIWASYNTGDDKPNYHRVGDSGSVEDLEEWEVLQLIKASNS